MKIPRLILMLCLVAMCLFGGVSCTVMHGKSVGETPGEQGAHKPSTATFFYASLGGDASALKISPTEASAGVINNSKTAMSAIRTVGTVSTAMIMNQMLERASTNAAAVSLGEQKTAAGIAAGKEATKQAGIAAGVQQTAIKAAVP